MILIRALSKDWEFAESPERTRRQLGRSITGTRLQLTPASRTFDTVQTPVGRRIPHAVEPTLTFRTVLILTETGGTRSRQVTPRIARQALRRLLCASPLFLGTTSEKITERLIIGAPELMIIG